MILPSYVDQFLSVVSHSPVFVYSRNRKYYQCGCCFESVRLAVVCGSEADGRRSIWPIRLSPGLPLRNKSDESRLSALDFVARRSIASVTDLNAEAQR
jgi:hypothetical protein